MREDVRYAWVAQMRNHLADLISPVYGREYCLIEIKSLSPSETEDACSLMINH